MPLNNFMERMLPAIESELQEIVSITQRPGLDELHRMLAYHLGWEGEGAGTNARGKRVRPLLVLLTTASTGCEWTRALPAAAAVELIHNFSLIHDDIQDDSPLRRGRPTVWTKWGIPLAINAGDSMFALAHIALTRLNSAVSPKTALQASQLLPHTSLTLTEGQYLDISYESRNDLTLDDYWAMIQGKTAALIAACVELGALTAEVDEDTLLLFRQFGERIGLAFQVTDDLLGIWGNATQMGKSAASDLISGKKSLPVLYGLQQNGLFAIRWREGKITPQEVPDIAAQLESEGALTFTQETADHLTGQALELLEDINPQGEAGEALIELAHKLVRRDG